MAKRLSQMSTADMQKDMSLAGSPEKITALMTRMNDDMYKTVDRTNVAELINIKFALDRLQAEVRVWARQYEKSSGQKINLG